MIYEYDDVLIHLRDCCDKVRDEVSIEYDYDEVAAPAAQVVADLMEKAFEKSGGKDLWVEYYSTVTTEAIAQGLKSREDFNKDEYIEYIDDIADITHKAYEQWYNEA